MTTSISFVWRIATRDALLPTTCPTPSTDTRVRPRFSLPARRTATPHAYAPAPFRFYLTCRYADYRRATRCLPCHYTAYRRLPVYSLAPASASPTGVSVGLPDGSQLLRRYELVTARIAGSLQVLCTTAFHRCARHHACFAYGVSLLDSPHHTQAPDRVPTFTAYAYHPPGRHSATTAHVTSTPTRPHHPPPGNVGR